VSRINVFLEPGATLADVRQLIAARLGERHRVKILSLRENLRYHDEKIRGAFGFARSLQILVALVTIAGIFDLLVSGIFERRRELAVWRLIGAAERTVRRTVVIESTTLGVLAAGLGLAVGTVSAWLWVYVIIPRLVGYDLRFDLAVVATLASTAVVLSMTALAGRAAAVRATRAPVLDGIRAR
jgi:putative ABC transport system permease protein